MSQEEVKAKISRDALGLCEDRIKSRALVALPEIMNSIKAQLEWLVSYFEGKNSERSKLFELTFGHYAAREVNEQDVEFIDALNKAFYVAVKTREGLKVDLSLLGISS
ncbi:MAG: immunity protein Tsi6 family protein [Halomonas sp.]|uniref:immunity protein Tsi6 family protein n=1 Tax=Halomonas sp. TaxID=1486246 RepID=UPI003F8E2753